jgi:glutamate carboxypeptidase
MTPFRAPFAVLLVALPQLVFAQLDDTERAIVAWSEDHANDAIALIERQVNINSGTMNAAGVRAVGEVLDAELQALGMDTEWIDLAAVNRGGHLFGRLNVEREGGTKFLLIGHLDTVFEPGDEFQEWSIDGNTATGPGVSDMKSGNAVIVYALKALQAVGVLEDMQIVVAYHGDEELPGTPVATARRDIIEAGQWADVALGFEPGETDDNGVDWATTSRRGFQGWVLRTSGRQTHSSRIFNEETGAGAIFEAARILSDFYDEVRGEDYLTFNAGLILGGTDINWDQENTRGDAFGKMNVVPRQTIVQGEMRTISQEQVERTKAAMQRVIDRHLPHTDAEIEFNETAYPAMPPSEGNERLRVQLSEINEQLGRGPMPAVNPLDRGAADIAFVAPYTDGMCGMGPSAEGAHTPNETLDLGSVPVAVQRAAILMYRLRLNPERSR